MRIKIIKIKERIKIERWGNTCDSRVDVGDGDPGVGDFLDPSLNFGRIRRRDHVESRVV